MTKYQYYISMVLDNGIASEDLKATTLKEARKQLQTFKKQLTKSFLKECNSIELYIDRCKIAELDTADYFENIYFKKIK